LEWLNGEITDSEKNIRGLKKVDTPILTDYQTNHNYIREHEGLDVRTSAEASTIRFDVQREVRERYHFFTARLPCAVFFC
jgi:hypothetical protein